MTTSAQGRLTWRAQSAAWGRYAAQQQPLRLSDQEREDAARDLGEHYVAGRLSVAEHAERLDRIWDARWPSDLAPLFADLPSPYAAATPRYPHGQPSSRLHPFGFASATGARGAAIAPAALKLLLIVLLAGLVLAHLPLLLLALGAWLVIRRSGGSVNRRGPHPRPTLR